MITKFVLYTPLEKTLSSVLEGREKRNKLCITKLTFRRDEHDLALNPTDKCQISMLYFWKMPFAQKNTVPGSSFLINNVVPGHANVSENIGIHHSVWHCNDTGGQQCQQEVICILVIHAAIISSEDRSSGISNNT